MKRKSKKIHAPNSEPFEYKGKFYVAIITEEKNPCKLCAFGKPKTNEEAHGCADHVCELETEQTYFEEVK